MGRIRYSILEGELAKKRVTRKQLTNLATHGGKPWSNITISNRLTGKSPVPLDWAKAIKEYLGCDMPLEELFAKETTE